MECWQLHDQSHRIVANCVIASEELNSIAFVTLYLMLALSLHSLRHVRASSGRPSRWLRSLLVENLQHMSTLSNLAPSQDVIDILTKSQAVCFDVDSTVISEEGIDELAGYKGVGEEVANLTKKAMGGSVLFQDALAERLDIIRPSRADLDTFLRDHPFHLTKGVEDFVSALHAKGKKVYLVSGGFRQMIEPVADKLNIPHHRIYANNLLFNPDGSFKGFDANEPTSRDGGKAAVVKLLKESHGYSNVVMIGDGVTDMQARPPADLFIGFGGVVVREKVQSGADWFVKDFQSLIDALKK